MTQIRLSNKFGCFTMKSNATIVQALTLKTASEKKNKNLAPFGDKTLPVLKKNNLTHPFLTYLLAKPNIDSKSKNSTNEKRKSNRQFLLVISYSMYNYVTKPTTLIKECINT